MRILTNELARKLAKHPFGSNDNGMDSEVIVKIFDPYGDSTWLITEAEKQEDGDWLLYGYCYMFEWEWGYVSLRELEGVRVGYGGYDTRLERDLWAHGTVKQMLSLDYNI